MSLTSYMSTTVREAQGRGLSYEVSKFVTVFVVWLLVFLSMSLAAVTVIMGTVYYSVVPVITVWFAVVVSNTINTRRYVEFKLTTEALMKQDALLLETIGHVISANKHNSTSIRAINQLLKKLSEPYNKETIH